MSDETAQTEVMPLGARVPGHSIVAQGAPHDEDGNNINRDYRWPHHVGGVGIGICSCGLWSPVLPSAYQRRKWHHEHRAEMWAEMAAARDVEGVHVGGCNDRCQGDSHFLEVWTGNDPRFHRGPPTTQPGTPAGSTEESS